MIDYTVLNPLQANIEYYWASVTIQVVEINQLTSLGDPVFSINQRCD